MARRPTKKRSYRPRMKKTSKGKRRGGLSGVREYASCSVNASLADANANQMYTYDTIKLADFSRAVQIAQSYQRFRIKKVTLTFVPSFDTYEATGAGAVQKPNLYYIIDKAGALPDNVTLEALKQAGAVAHPLDEKQVYVSWRPSVLVENQAYQTGGGPTFPSPSGYRVSPWLATNQNASNPGAWTASMINHLGIKFYIEQGNFAAAYAFPIDIKVEFEFTKAIWSSLSSTPAIGLTFKALNDSPDGVVGGKDGI